jgi:aryl-alcohol dehydrogenase-like predicted oxidoreductase
MAYMIGEANAWNLQPIVSIQASYDLLDRQVEMETVPFCKRFGIAIMCYGPLCGGILTGKYGHGEQIPEGSRGEKNKHVRAYLEDEAVRRDLAQIDAVAGKSGLEMNQLAILWLKAQPHATVVILGGSSPEHFRQIYEVADRDLPEDAVAEVSETTGNRIYSPFKNQPIREGAPVAEVW